MRALAAEITGAPDEERAEQAGFDSMAALKVRLWMMGVGVAGAAAGQGRMLLLSMTSVAVLEGERRRGGRPMPCSRCGRG